MRVLVDTYYKKGWGLPCDDASDEVDLNTTEYRCGVMKNSWQIIISKFKLASFSLQVLALF